MFRFIHAADIHLDSPLLNLNRYEGAPEESLRVATREAFDNLVQLAIDHQVQFLLIAGDLYDKDSPDFHTPMHVRRQFQRLCDNGIPVYVIQGNHDAETHSKRAFSSLTMPENVHVFSTKRPETRTLDEINVAIHGQGFATRAVNEDLSAGYPDPVPGYFNIGLLHTNLSGNGNHDNYAPSTPEGLRLKGYQYWALGHIHKRDPGIGGPKQIIHYAGNTQGRHIRESGPKGCTLVTVDGELRISMQFLATDVWRWESCEVDLEGLDSPDDLADRVASALEPLVAESDDRPLAVRIRLQGRTDCYASLLGRSDHWERRLRGWCLDRWEDRIWVEKIRWKIQPTAARQAHDVDADLLSQIDDADWTEQLAELVADRLKQLRSKIPTDPRMNSLQEDWDNPEFVQAAFQSAKQMLVAQLLADPADIAEDDAL